MPLKTFTSLHPTKEIEVVIDIEEVEEMFNPEAGKASNDPFHDSIEIEEETLETPVLDYRELTVKELKIILKQRKLSTSGKKDDLIIRLKKSDEEAAKAASDSEEVPVDTATSEEKVSKYGEANISTDEAI
tara:strand:+ start:382 stop:774 length:393 start_codon:yes stop_codon:yes gene_type:complete